MANVIKMNELDLAGRRVLIRQDLNVPLHEGQITNDARIRASLPTLRLALDKGAAVMVMSHLGRPQEGAYDPILTLQPIADALTEALGVRVNCAQNWIDGVDIQAGEIVLCENVRFLSGEKSCQPALAEKMARLCDVFVMDAFGTAHRAQASTYGVAQYAPIACAGPLLAAELEALAHALQGPQRPMVAIVGGSKVSTKLNLLEQLLSQVDQLVVGGGIANTFIAAAGYPIGQSLYEQDLLDTAKRLISEAKARGAEIPIPVDVVCAKEFTAQAQATIKSVQAVAPDDLILDIGPESCQLLADMIHRAGTVVWNGPLGVFEFDHFAQGTATLSEAIASSSAFSIAGGGDTVAAIDKFILADDISYISTGGGAFLEFLEGKTLPAVEILQQRAQ